MREAGKSGGTATTVLFLILCLHAGAARAVLIDRIVAAVGLEVITRSDLRRAMEFNEAMGTGGGDREQLASRTLEGLINRKLILREAGRLRFVEVTPEDIAAELEKLKTRLGSKKAFEGLLARLDMSSEELGRMLGERLLVGRFIEKKVSLMVRVTHDEALTFYESHPKEFRGKRFSEVQKKITAILTDQKIGRQIDDYVAELRSRADIRINPPVEGAA